MDCGSAGDEEWLVDWAINLGRPERVGKIEGPGATSVKTGALSNKQWSRKLYGASNCVPLAHEYVGILRTVEERDGFTTATRIGSY